VYAKARGPTAADAGAVTLRVGGALEIAIVTETTAGFPLPTAVSIMMVPEWLPGSSVVALTVTVNTKGDRPEDGVTESQPCGLDAAVTTNVWLLIAAGRVTVNGLVFVVLGGVELFAVYAKLMEVAFAVGPDWAPADQQQSKANNTFGTNVFMALLSGVLLRNFSRLGRRATRADPGSEECGWNQRSWNSRKKQGFANRKPGTANIEEGWSRAARLCSHFIASNISAGPAKTIGFRAAAENPPSSRLQSLHPGIELDR
jgi:hypothetical protein